MPSVRVDSTRLIAGACVVSAYPGHGIRGGDVPSSGEHAPPILYAGLSLPAEANDEFRVLILTRPGTLPGLVIREDSSVEVPEGSPVGTHSGTWRGYKNGAVFAPDPQTFEIVIGPSEISGDAAVDEPGAGGGMASAAELSGDAAIDEPTAGGGAESAAQISGDAAIDEPGAGGGMSSAGTSAITGDATIDEPTAAGGAESAAEVSGDAAIDEPGAGGGMSSAGTSAITGDAQVDEPGAGGGMESAAQLSGDAAIDEPGAGGGMESLPSGSMTGDAQTDEPSAGGGMQSAAELGGNAQIDEPSAAGGFSMPGQVQAEINDQETGEEVFAAAISVVPADLYTMHYATPDDMVARFGEAEIVQLTDRSPQATSPNFVVLDAALFDADAEINARLQPRFAVPTLNRPRLLINLACDIARYKLYDDRATDQVTRRYEDALKQLDKVAEGKLNLGLDLAQQPTAAVGGPTVVTGGKRVFGPGQLGDYSDGAA